MPAIDPWANASGGITGPITDVLAATPHDTTEEVREARALYIGVAGNVSILTEKGQSVILSALAAGMWHPIRVRRVNITGTGAGVTGILLGY